MVNVMKVTKREGTGKNKVDKLRREDVIPAVIYIKGKDAKTVQIEAAEFSRAYKAAGSSSVFMLNVDGEEVSAIIKDIQRHPYKNLIVHVDFQELIAGEKIKLSVPVILNNRDTIRLQPSVLTQMITTLDIECTPAHIPTNGAEVDVENMDFTTAIFIKDLDLAQNENITIARDLDEIVCTLNPPTVGSVDEEEETEEAFSPAEVEVIGEKKED